MAQLSGLLKRGILDSLWTSLPGGVSLEDAIRAFKNARWSDVQGGRLILSTSGGGYSVSFAGADTYRRISPDMFLELGQELLEVRRDTLAALTAAGAATDDESLFQSMLEDDRLYGVTATTADFSCRTI